MKASRYGIKIYKLTTVDSYVLVFKVYCGAEEREDESLPVSQAVVTDLMDRYLDEGNGLRR